MREKDKAELLGAIARGWCHKKNSSKVMDSDLAMAIYEEVIKLINHPHPPLNMKNKYKISRKKLAKLVMNIGDKRSVHKITRRDFVHYLLATTDNSGATPDEVTHFKHTAKVRPQYISGRKVHKLQELLETNICDGMTQIRVLDDFWNWSEEVTEKLNQILNYLHL